MIEDAADGHPWVPGSFQRSRIRVTEEWRAFQSGAEEGSTEVLFADRALRGAETALDEARSLVAARPGATMDAARIHLAVAEADKALEGLVDRGLRETKSRLERAQEERRHDIHIVLLWNAVSVGSAIVLAALGISSVRRHAQVLEVKASELEQFADRVAHDLRGPLMPVMLALRHGEKKMGADTPAGNVMARGLRSVRVVESILADLLSFARSGARPEPGAEADMRSVLDDSLAEFRLLADEARVSLSIEPFENCKVACNRGALAVIVGNLVRNAVDHMGGAAERRVILRVRVALDARLEVEDTGPGLPNDLLSVVFEPRVQGSRTAGGLGLGLATVKRLVEAHGGSVGVESTPGRGSTFWVCLPRVAPSRTRFGQRVPSSDT